MRYFALFVVLAFIVTACGQKTDPNTEINQAVAATLSSIPTQTSRPLPTPFPTPTAFSLQGLFCEYQFCIGHPSEMAFFDVNAQQNAGSPSSYSQGLIASYSPNLFIQAIWQIAPGTSDPQFMLDLILDSRVDTRTGTPNVTLVRDMHVIYTPITSTVSPVLPYGAAAAWTCGERVFAWKVYSPTAENTKALFDAAFDRFICNR